MKKFITILVILFCFDISAQTFSSPNVYVNNVSVYNGITNLCTSSVIVNAEITVISSDGISSSEIPTPSLYYGNYNTTQIDEDFSQWELKSGDYFNGTYTATITVDPSNFMAGAYGLKLGTWRTSNSSKYGYYDNSIIFENNCGTSPAMYHYKFEENINNSAIGSNGNGTNNYPTWSWLYADDRFSQNKSIDLDGSMHIDLNSNLKLKTSYNQGITLSAWLFIDDNTNVDSFRYIIDLTDGSSNNNWDSRVLMALTSSSTIKLGTNHSGILDGSQNFNVESLSVNTGEWIFVTGVWDLDNDTLSIYINGNQQNTATNISSINSLDLSGGASGSKRIGQRVFATTNSTGWIGKIDDVKFYNTALTSTTILNLYDINKPISPGVNSQSSTYSTTLELDGSSSFIEIPTSTDLKFDSDKFTLEAWIKIENGPSSGSKDYIFRKTQMLNLS